VVRSLRHLLTYFIYHILLKVSRRPQHFIKYTCHRLYFKSKKLNGLTSQTSLLHSYIILAQATTILYLIDRCLVQKVHYIIVINHV